MFQDFVAKQLGAQAFVTNPEDHRTDLFHASLESSKALFGFANKTRNKAGDAFKLHVGFIEDQRPNALADVWQCEHFIGMHSSLFVSVNEFAMFCFAQAEFFPDVGTASAETSPKPWNARVPGLWLLDHTIQGGRVEQEHSERLIPKESDRFIMSQYLAMLMARFTWLHELSHCFNGHVAYARRHNLAMRLYELADGMNAMSVRKRKVSAEDRETLKCLEFDADQSALWAGFNIQFGNMENLDGITALEPALRLRMTLFGAYAMIWLIDEYQSYLDAQEGDTHPPPSLRLQNLLRTTKQRILPIGDQLSALHGDVLHQFDTIRAAVPSMYSSAEFTDIQSDARMAELIAFDRRSADVKAQLRDFEFSERY
ncbi:hypothetical protein [uncultured Roseobacter sp.]|uniref:hypothetical protein n=1 Tax=uncultured Roseobacter sp. TaxID=114847 RepID=UPI002631BA4B|nr:hypothetical protein [uncultured Roseobacter sp.]